MDKYYLLVDIDGTLSDASERAKKYLGGDVQRLEPNTRLSAVVRG